MVLNVWYTQDILVIRTTVLGAKSYDVELKVTSDILNIMGEIRDKLEVDQRYYLTRWHN